MSQVSQVAVSDVVLPVGKYQGQKLADVFSNDPGYVAWMANKMEPRTDQGKALQAAAKALVGGNNGHGSNGNGHGKPKAVPPAPRRNGNGNGRHSRPAAKTSQLRQTSPVTEVPDSFTPSVIERLREPFLSGMVQWKAQSTTKDKKRALAVAYIDARAVMDRLDAVVGAGNWHDKYQVLRIAGGNDEDTWSSNVPSPSLASAR